MALVRTETVGIIACNKRAQETMNPPNFKPNGQSHSNPNQRVPEAPKMDLG